MRPVAVVTGIGVVSPFGTSRDAFRDALLAGDSGIGPLPAVDVTACRTTRGAAVRRFTPTDWIPAMKLRRMDDTARYAIVAARQAVDDAAFVVDESGDDTVGVVMGTFTAGGQTTSEYLRALHDGGPTAAPAILFNTTVANAPASLAGLELKLRGPNVTLTQKECSGLAALIWAADAVRLGRAAAMIAGGVDALFDIFFRVHDRFGVMARDPEIARPFDRARGGFLLGEGGVALLIEDAARAAARGAQPYGTILGVGSASAAVGINQWPSSPAPLVRTMRAALADASLQPYDISVVYASANGAPALDSVEAEAIATVFGAARPLVTTLKGALGECGMSGAAACAAALLCAAVDGVPPVVGLQQPDGAAAALALVRTCQPLPGPVVLINSVASGGALCSLVLRAERGSTIAAHARAG